MSARLHAAAGWIAALAVVTPPQTEPSDCASVTERYKQNVEAVTEALRKYEACVSGSNAVAQPRATMSIRFGRSGGVLTAHFKAGNGAPPIARVLMDLPKGVKGVRKGLQVTAAAKVSRKSLHVKGRRLDARLGKAGAVKIALRWRGLKASAALLKTLDKGSTLPFVVRVKDTGRRTTKLLVPARVTLSRK